jgi:hypothetical protein
MKKVFFGSFVFFILLLFSSKCWSDDIPTSYTIKLTQDLINNGGSVTLENIDSKKIYIQAQLQDPLELNRYYGQFFTYNCDTDNRYFVHLQASEILDKTNEYTVTAFPNPKEFFPSPSTNLLIQNNSSDRTGIVFWDKLRRDAEDMNKFVTVTCQKTSNNNGSYNLNFTFPKIYQQLIRFDTAKPIKFYAISSTYTNFVYFQRSSVLDPSVCPPQSR